MSIKKVKLNRLGWQLMELREQQGLTREQVAERGAISKHTIVSCESGHVPSLRILVRMLKVYGYGIYIGRTKYVERQSEGKNGQGDRGEGPSDSV